MLCGVGRGARELCLRSRSLASPVQGVRFRGAARSGKVPGGEAPASKSLAGGRTADEGEGGGRRRTTPGVESSRSSTYSYSCSSPFLVPTTNHPYHHHHPFFIVTATLPPLRPAANNPFEGVSILKSRTLPPSPASPSLHDWTFRPLEPCAPLLQTRSRVAAASHHQHTLQRTRSIHHPRSRRSRSTHTRCSLPSHGFPWRPPLPSPRLPPSSRHSRKMPRVSH